jgi:uncharacterized protein (UPF0333 family)
MKFLKENKAQGALEYLLIIGGAIVLAAIVIAVVINVASTPKSSIGDSTTDYNKLLSDADKNIKP